MYIFLKILHIVAFTSWMAGLFYLPRLFVYHCGADATSKMDKTFQIMEYKLYFYIMWPAMVVTILSGIFMIYIKFLQNEVPEIQLWGIVKIFFVAMLIWYHIRLNVYRKHFIQNINTHSHRFYRFLNEVPTVIFIIIVTSVVVKFTW